MDGRFAGKKVLAVGLTAVLIAVVAAVTTGYRGYAVPIMMYHHVSPDNVSQSDTVSPRRFEWHMAYLKANHFNVLSLSDLVRAVRERKSLPRKSVVITFDDGYQDNYTHAFPVLKKYHFPATMFVISDVINTPGFLTTAQIREMAAWGIEIGSHTRTHPYLPETPEGRLADEIAGSKRKLEEDLGIRVVHFCYPSGGFNEEIKDIVRRSGYESASTTNRGDDRSGRDVYELKRVRFSDDDRHVTDLWIKLTGLYNLSRQNKSPY
ncbi:MAG: polysaccharide deacetylase family protein [Candidatus Omnitrophica bacterium]|nr:polysaccharide deacetylase family protein [Candidatus Omnitrophota bacterium]